MQAYISPPIAVCFIFGILWTRVNAAGAITSLLSGFVLGTLRFVFEVVDKTHRLESPAIRWFVDMNFLHYAIFMFVVCAAILAIVSVMTPPPPRRKLAGLTFATVDEKIETTAVPGVRVRKPAAESPAQYRINLAASAVLVLTVVILWIYFR